MTSGQGESDKPRAGEHKKKSAAGGKNSASSPRSSGQGLARARVDDEGRRTFLRNACRLEREAPQEGMILLAFEGVTEEGR